MLNSSLFRTNAPLFRTSPLFTTSLRSRNAVTFLFGCPPNPMHLKFLFIHSMKGQAGLNPFRMPSCRRFIVTYASNSYSYTRLPEVDWERKKMSLPYLKLPNSRYGRVAVEDSFKYGYDDRMIVPKQPVQTMGQETIFNLNQWERKLEILLSNNEVQEIVSREKKDRRDFQVLSALATRMGLLSCQYTKVVVFSKVRLPTYRPDLDDEKPQREVRLPIGLQGKVEFHLTEYLSQKPPHIENFEYKKIIRSNRSGVSTINGVRRSHKSLNKINSALNDICFNTSLRLSNQQQKWQESSDGGKMQDFRKGLPAYKERDGFLKIISENQVVVVSGETGCGKTTQLPQYILESEIKANRGANCSIICTQPRRISAMSVSERVAAERGEKLGDSVGYKVRLEGMKSSDTRLLFCTTGVLLRRLISDGDLQGVTHVVVDEIHERGKNEDFLLVILKDMLPRRPDLRLILMSATLNADLFSSYFGSAPMIHIPGFTYPVQTYFLEDILEATRYRLDPYNQIDDYGKEKEYKRYKQLALLKRKSPIAAAVEDGLKAANFSNYSSNTRQSLSCWNPDSIGFNLIQQVLCHIVSQQTPGAVLVFMIGWDDINSLKAQLQAHHILGDSNKVLLLACHGSMSSSEQRLIFDKPQEGVRKIVLATNMAETSITINDVVFVVDAGKAKETSYDALNNTPCLLPSWISKAAARQRRGRAGRVQPGVCYHLYPRCVYDTFSDYQIPELLRTPLESLSLQIKSLQLGSITDFLSKALQPPEPLSIQNAIEYLKIIGALDEDENMTVLGHNLAMLPVEPKLGKMLILGTIFDCLDPILTIVASLSCRDPFLMPFDKKDLAQTVKAKFSDNNYSDHLALVRAYEGWKDAEGKGYGYDYCWSNFLSPQIMKAIDSLRNQFSMVLRETGLLYSHSGTKCIGSRDAHLIQAIICAGLFPGICSVVNKEKSLLLKTMDDGQVLLHGVSVNAQNAKIPYPWLVFNEKMKVNAVFLRDSTAICDSVLLLFGGNISKGGPGHLRMLGGYFEFFMQSSLANVYFRLKDELEEMIQNKLQNPKLDLRTSHNNLLSAIHLLISGDNCMGKFTSKGHSLEISSKSTTSLSNICGGNGGDNPKNELQMILARSGGHGNPLYDTRQVAGNLYSSTVTFYMKGYNIKRVVGMTYSSKKEAEKSAAAEALKSMVGKQAVNML